VQGGDEARVDSPDVRAEDALSRFLPPEDPGIVRRHHVTALIVARDGSEWILRTLDGIAAQVRAPEQVIFVDTSPSDGCGDLLRDRLPRALHVWEPGGFAEGLAVASALDLATPSHAVPGPSADGPGDVTGDPDPDSPIRWYWILHDDSAPEPGCLERLLVGADRAPDADVLVPKTVAWSDRTRLVGIGNMWAPGTPVVERLEPGERDQGQYDVDRPVYGGETAGMLVRADTWHALGGLDARYETWGAGPDLCRRVWGTGAAVMFVPGAVVSHRHADRLGLRPGAQAPPAPRRAARRGQLMLELTQAPVAALPWRWLRAWLSTAVRAIALLLTREPEEAAAELAGAWEVLVRPGSVRSGRRALRRPPVQSTARPAGVRARRGAVLGHSLDAWNAARRIRPGRVRPSRALGFPLAVAGLLAVAAVVREPGQLGGAGSLHGGGLLAADPAPDLIRAYLASWQDARFGVPTMQPAYLPVLAAASLPVLGSVDAVLRLAFGLAVPLAFLSAYASLGPAWSRTRRTLLALAWSLLPAGVAAMSGGRVSTLGLLLLGPPTARLVVRAMRDAHGPAPRARPAIAGGVMLGLTSAFAPLVLPFALLAGLLAWLARGLPRWPVRPALVMAGIAALFPATWWPRVVDAPWLLLSDLGRNDPSLAAPAPWVWGLSPGGPTSVAWAGAGLLVVSVLAVLLAPPRASTLAALATAVVLLVAVQHSGLAVRALWPRADPAALWPGQALLVAGGLLVLVVAAATAGQGARGGSLTVGLGVAVAVLAAGWWVAPVTTTTGRDSTLPPVVALAGESPDRPRALVLERAGSAVRYAIATGPRARLGDADALAAPDADPEFARVVEDLVSGVGGDLGADLGRRAIRYVVMNGPPDDALAAVLDASIGLRRLATADDQSLWLVTGLPARAELIGRSDDPDVSIPVLTRPTSIDVVLHPETLLPRILVLAERADPGWVGTIDGKPLVLSSDEQGMTAAQVSAPGRLSAHHRGLWSSVARIHLILLVVLVVLALPKRRTLDPQRVVAP
jgi:GT2 family glycosyltransferase